MIDLTTSYLGLTLSSPVVCSSSPLCENLDTLLEMQECGAGAVVLPSLFEEQLQTESHLLDWHLDMGADSHAEATNYFPSLGDYNMGPDGYLEHLRRSRSTLSIPVIASLNGHSRGGWLDFAKRIEDAGADALELNVYYLATKPDETSLEVEEGYLDLVADIRRSVRIPLAVKLGPFFSAPVEFGRRLCDAGADGLVLFNRFYQPDFNLDTLDVVPNLHLSSPNELLMRLHWVGLMYGQVPTDLAVTGGVHSGLDVLKVMMAGGKVAMMTSALLKHGINWICHVINEINEWMLRHEYESIRQMQGSMSFRKVGDPSAYERANYMKTLRSYSFPIRRK